jgi:hypothetical protein
MKTNSIYRKDSGGRRSAKIFCLSLLSAISILFGAENISAQTNGDKRRTKTKVSQIKPKTINAANVAAQKPAPGSTNSGVTLLNRVEADYLSGEGSVSVNPKQPTVIRLGLAQNATSVVEFPSVDQIYYIHEGNPKLVTVFQSPTRTTDRSITLYPGEGFLPVSAAAIAGQKELSVTITMQMKSGLVIVLEIVPAPGIGQNAHRCVLNYNTAEVVAARRAAGLKVNLGDEVDAPKQIKQTRAVSTLVTANLTKESDSSEKENTENPSSSFVEIADGASNKTDSTNRKMKTGTELSRLVNKKLAEAIKSPKEKFTIWSPAVKGLSLSTAKTIEIDGFQRLLIVAVKNVSIEGLRLLDEMPGLQIQTVDKSGGALQLERLERKFVETTALVGAIPAGGVVYYAVVYENPVLGANQKLLVFAAHDRASDAPVVASTNPLNVKEAR